MKKRTSWIIPCQISIVSDDWKNQAYAHKPFNENINIERGFQLLQKDDLEEGQHLIHLAQNWQKAILNKHYESSAQIANEVGISSGRVRQIIRLNNLHPEIQQILMDGNTSLLPPQYSAQNLRKASSMTQIDQLDFLRNSQ